MGAPIEMPEGNLVNAAGHEWCEDVQAKPTFLVLLELVLAADYERSLSRHRRCSDRGEYSHGSCAGHCGKTD